MTPDPLRLADAALAGLPPGEATQDQFDETNFAKVKFVGMSFDTLDHDMKIGDEAHFLVRARCVGTGDEEMNDGHVRTVAKMRVLSVVLREGEG